MRPNACRAGDYHARMKMLTTVRSPLVLLVLSLAACGGGGSGSSDGGGVAPGGDGGSGGGVAADLSQPGTPVARTQRPDGETTLVSAAGRAATAAASGALAVRYEVVENQGGDTPYDCRAVGAQFGSCSVTNLHIKDADGQLSDGNWSLYFHSLRRVLRVDSDELDVFHVNGDLYYVRPDASFDGLDGDVETLRLITEFSHLMQSDLLPRYWLVRDGQAAQQIAGTEPGDGGPATDQSWALPIDGDNRRQFNGEPAPLATPATRFDANRAISEAAAQLTPRQVQARIVPQPVSTVVGTGSLDISSGISFAGGPLPAASSAALAERQRAFLSSADGTPTLMSLDDALGAGAYRLTVDANGIAIVGGDAAGVFNGAQSVLSLVQPGVGTVPFVQVEDAPRFDFRAMHVDVARNMMSVDALKRVIEQMAAYKLNVLHLHLSDDEGWRLAIPSLPELTEVGARRGFELDGEGNVFEGRSLMPQLGSGAGSDNSGSGHFTRAEFVDLLRFAQARFVSVIPEFDMPAHARAAVVAMRARASVLGTPDSTDVRIDDPADTSRYRTIQNYDDGILNPCVPGTYAFIGTVIDEVAAMYRDAGAPLDIWHMGGDEARNIFKGAGFGPSGVAYDPDAWDFPWERSPACAAFIAATPGVDSRDDLEPYFVQRVSQLVDAAGIPAMYAWMDILDGVAASDLATARAGVDFWEVISAGDGYDRIGGYVERGYETIVAVPDFTYFDFTQEIDPAERGQYWATRFTDTAKVFAFAPENLPQNAETSVTREGGAWQATGTGAAAQVRGLQGHLWSEVVRSGEQLDYMIFPRLLALAERAWHRADWELDYAAGASFGNSSNRVPVAALQADYAGFAAALGAKELPKLDAAGVNYRIPVPGARIVDGQLSMNVAFPGLTLQAGDGSTFTEHTAGQSAAGIDTVRAVTRNGRLGRSDAIE